MGRNSWRRLDSQGFRLVQSEWHHAAFEPDNGNGARSTVSVVLHVVNVELTVRYVVEGDLDVDWHPRSSRQEAPRPRGVAARNLQITQRTGVPPFEQAYQHELRGPTELVVLVYDLNGDGLSEIVVPSFNLLLHNLGGCKFEQQVLANVPPPSDVTAAVLADLTGNGSVDLLCAGSTMNLYTADRTGRFTSAPVPVDTPGLPITSPAVITAGDIDADGDLDLWLGQYKYPMLGGQMPTPYFDANDGYPSFLLRNEGSGRSTDATQAAGLGRIETAVRMARHSSISTATPTWI